MSYENKVSTSWKPQNINEQIHEGSILHINGVWGGTFYIVATIDTPEGVRYTLISLPHGNRWTHRTVAATNDIPKLFSDYDEVHIVPSGTKITIEVD